MHIHLMSIDLSQDLCRCSGGKITLMKHGHNMPIFVNEECRCFIQAPASKFIVMRVRLGWCAKGHKIYTGSG